MSELGASAYVRRLAVRCHRPGCGALIVWVLTEAGRRQPVNLEPAPAGTVAVRAEGTGRLRGRVLAGDRDQLEGTERRHVAHAATCGRDTITAARTDGVIPLYPARARRQRRTPPPERTW